MARYSKQRELVYNTIIENPVHPTADEVYNMVRKVSPNISLGTIYRNLNYLVDEGKLIRISIPDKADKFDGTIKDHCHVVCVDCGKVFDFAYDLKNIEDEVQKQTGVSCCKTHLAIEGICTNCKN